MVRGDIATTDGSGATVLVTAVRRLADTQTEADVVEIVRHAARQLVEADGATFVLREDDRCRYVDEDAIAPLWKGRAFPMSACISGWSMLHRSAVSIEDVFADDRIPHDAYRPTFVHSLVMVPIRTEDPIGAIGAYWARPRKPTPEEVSLLQALADSTAVALTSARLRRELDTRAVRTQELASANAELREISATVAHDIRSPLTTLIGFSELMVARYEHDKDSDAYAMARGVRNAAGRLSSFVNDLLDYFASGDEELRVEPVHIPEVVAEVRERLAAEIAQQRATVAVVAGDDDVWANRTQLSRALQNLVSNAITHRPDGRDPVVEIGVSTSPDGWDITVNDNGDGIPADEREAIFAPFKRGRDTAGHAGSGLGLALCRRVAEQHRGTLAVGDAPGGGASFVLHLPRPPAATS